MNLKSFLQAGINTISEVFPTKVLEFYDGATINVIFNTKRHGDSKQMGGYELDDTVTVLGKVTDMCDDFNPQTLLDTKCKLDGFVYRIDDIVKGDVSIQFTLLDEHKV